MGTNTNEAKSSAQNTCKVKSEKITAPEIVALLKDKYRDHRQFAYATEVGNGTGLSQTRRIDMVVVNCYESKNLAIEGIEIKVSRADLRKELQNSEKHNIFYDNLDYFSLAIPQSILDWDIIPKKWGVYTVSNGVLNVARRPLSLHDEKITNIDKKFAVALMRRMFGQAPGEEEFRQAVMQADADGYKRGKHDAMKSWENRSQEEMEALTKLKDELWLYDKESIDRAIEGFKRYRKMDSTYVVEKIARLKSTLDEISDVLTEEIQGNGAKENAK